MYISPIFNVADLYKYHEYGDEMIESSNYPKRRIDEIEHSLDQTIGKSTRGKDYFEYLVKWKDMPIEDVAWISQSKLGSSWVVIHS